MPATGHGTASAMAKSAWIAYLTTLLRTAGAGDMPMDLGSQPLGWTISSELLPGTVVGQGRYVLAEKLCEVCRLPESTSQPQHLALPLPSQRLLLDDGQWQGQVIPYEGLAAAIASDLPHPQIRLQFLPAVHEYAVSHLQRHQLYHDATFRYNFGQRLGKGSFGEAWRAVTLDGSMKEVVLKRLFVEKGEHVRRSGEREIYFGSILQHRHHIARFLESFEEVSLPEDGRRQVELWLVFENEGFSLTHFLFKTQPGSQVVERSTFWWLVKQGLPWGGQVIKNFAYQLLQGLAVAHAANITHRDVKGSNVFVTDTWPPIVRLGDFGSALKAPPTEDVRKLYGPEGPTEDDETSEYKPPEAGLFDEMLLRRVGLAASPDHWHNRSYDMWSLGVLLLELVLGTRDLYHVDDRRWLKEEFQLGKEHIPEERIGQGRMLLALLDLCLGPNAAPTAPLLWFLKSEPELSVPAGGQKCSGAEFAERLRQQDAAGVGLPNAAGRDLLRRLLQWDPNERIQAQDALKHPWFDDGVDLPPLRVFKSAGGGLGKASREDEVQAHSADGPRIGAGVRALRKRTERWPNGTMMKSTPLLESTRSAPPAQGFTHMWHLMKMWADGKTWRTDTPFTTSQPPATVDRLATWPSSMVMGAIGLPVGWRDHCTGACCGPIRASMLRWKLPLRLSTRNNFITGMSLATMALAALLWSASCATAPCTWPTSETVERWEPSATCVVLTQWRPKRKCGPAAPG